MSTFIIRCRSICEINTNDDDESQYSDDESNDTNVDNEIFGVYSTMRQARQALTNLQKFSGKTDYVIQKLQTVKQYINENREPIQCGSCTRVIDGNVYDICSHCAERIFGIHSSHPQLCGLCATIISPKLCASCLDNCLDRNGN